MMFSWIRRLFVGNPPPSHQIAEDREQAVYERLAKIRGTTPQEVRAAARRRAMEIEVRSYRSHQ